MGTDQTNPPPAHHFAVHQDSTSVMEGAVYTRRDYATGMMTAAMVATSVIVTISRAWRHSGDVVITPRLVCQHAACQRAYAVTGTVIVMTVMTSCHVRRARAHLITLRARAAGVFRKCGCVTLTLTAQTVQTRVIRCALVVLAPLTSTAVRVAGVCRASGSVTVSRTVRAVRTSRTAVPPPPATPHTSGVQTHAVCPAAGGATVTTTVGTGPTKLAARRVLAQSQNSGARPGNACVVL